MIEPQKHSGDKYLRSIRCKVNKQRVAIVDVYRVLDAFKVTCPARQHAIKKLLCAGIRGKGDELQDLWETADAVKEAIALQESRIDDDKPIPVGDVSPEQPKQVFSL